MGIFCFVNLMIIKVLNNNLFSTKNRNKVWTTLTIIAGLLTFSFGFYILFFLFILIDFLTYKNFKYFLILFIIAIILPIYYFIFEYSIDILSTSSLSDRLNRIICGIDYISSANIDNLLFGYGPFTHCMIYNPGLDTITSYGFSSGYMRFIVERGFINFLIILTFAWYIVKSSHFSNIIFYLIIMILVTFLDQYYALFSLLVLFSTEEIKKISNLKIKI